MRYTKTIRAKVTLTTAVFSLVIMMVFFTLAFSTFADEQRQNVVRGTEFNLQLTADTVDSMLQKLVQLQVWSVGFPTMSTFLRNEHATAKDSLLAYKRLDEEWRANSAGQYILRLVVTDGTDKLLQIGSNRINSDKTVTLAMLREQQFSLPNDINSMAYFGNDCLSNLKTPAFLFLRPVLMNRQTRENGLSYMAVSAEVLTDPLKNYNLPEGDEIFITIEGRSYQIENGVLRPAALVISSDPAPKGQTLDSNTKLCKYTNSRGEDCILVSYPLSSLPGWYLSHSIVSRRFTSFSERYFTLLLMLAVALAAAGVLLSLYMNRIISRPVGNLRARMEKIAGGDFSRDEGIEWDNELGDVGRGVNQLSHDVKLLMASRLADEKEKQTLEYKMLQSQINPHFIYNTLNSIKWMATIQNATGIAEMTTAFSRLLKSVSKGNEELITLREELALLNDYCVIQQYRYGGGITAEVADISDEGLCDCMIPRFTLQPLAENAIFHGIEPKGGVGSILLSISQTGSGDVRIVMTDDGIGMSAKAIKQIFEEQKPTKDEKFHQIGIRNVHRRIQFAFGASYGITIESEPGLYTRATILIPHCLQNSENRAKTKGGGNEP